jgi:hypothetical protein
LDTDAANEIYSEAVAFPVPVCFVLDENATAVLPELLFMVRAASRADL